MLKRYDKIVVLIFVCFCEVVYSQKLCSNNHDCSFRVSNRKTEKVRRVSCVTQFTAQEQENKTIAEVGITNPTFENIDKMWYLHQTSSDKNQYRIALKIKWKPPKDASVQYLKGYTLFVRDRTENKSIFRFFNLTSNLTSDDVMDDFFQYNCIGTTEEFSIKPKDKIMVQITSYPPSQHNRSITRYFTIPSCKDSTLRKTTTCRNQTPFVKVKNGCVNRVKTIKYRMPPSEGDSVNILLCHKSTQRVNYCTKEIQFADFLPLNGTFNLKLPKKYSKIQHYAVQIWGSENSLRYTKAVSFMDCEDDLSDAQNQESNEELAVPPEAIAGVVASIIPLLIFVYIVFTTLQRRKRKKDASKEQFRHQRQIDINPTVVTMIV